MLLRFRCFLWAFAVLSAHAQTLRTIAVDPVNRNMLWGASVSGSPERSVLYRSLDQSQTWQGIPFHSDRVNPARIYDIKTHPDLANRVYVLAKDTAGYLWISLDGGISWKNPGADWAAGLSSVVIRVAPSPSQLVYVQLGRQLRRSTDGGTTFGPAITIPCAESIEMSLSNPNRLACSSNGALSYSTDGGSTWERGATVAAISASCTLLNHKTTETLYYVYCFTTQSGGQSDLYFRSVDGLQTLSPLTFGPSLGGIAASPDRGLILVDRLNTTYRSRDLGTTWEPMANLRLGFAPFGFDPLDSTVLYYQGRSKSIDTGTTFTELNPRFLPIPSYVSTISTGGVVTLGGLPKIAPGAIFSIYGAELADATTDSPVPPLKTKLGSTSVQVNGIEIPLFFVSTGQINAQMPYGVPAGTAGVRVIRNGISTNQENAQIAAAAPDLIQYGAGRAVAVNQDGQVNAPNAPAAKGSYVVLYLTGIGAVSPALSEGVAAPVDPLSRAALPYRLTVSTNSTSAEAMVIFLGHTPTFAGLVQANFQVPDLTPGEYNLILTVGGEASNPVKFTVGP